MNLLQKHIFGFLVLLLGLITGGILSFCSADGIYWNQTGGIISVVLNGTVKYTLQDKNLGATCTDISSRCSYGNFYEWGNNYPFQLDGTYSESSNSINLDGYGPGNYFNSNGVWQKYNSPLNQNAWGYVSGTFLSMKGPCPNGFHVPTLSDLIGDVQSHFGSTNGSFYQNYFFMPYAGLKYISSYQNEGSRGLYWSNRVVENSVNGLYLNESPTIAFGGAEAYIGMSVRCFKNDLEEPDYSWIKLYGDTIEKPAMLTVIYNGDSSKNFICSGDNSITINGLSTYNNNTFIPYMNISYKDEDNQNLVESYSNSFLYLENGLFKKTYTGDNDWILTIQGGSSEGSFSGYLPTFEITGGIKDVSESGNIFNNFAENSVKFTLSNIPSYIQYVIILLILFFIIGFIRKFRKK